MTALFHSVACSEFECDPPAVYRWTVTTTGRLVERSVELPGCSIGDPAVRGGGVLDEDPVAAGG